MQYLKEKLLDGKSINVKGLGMFTFEIRSDLPCLASKEISTTKTLTGQRKERKHVHGLRPCCVVDPNVSKDILAKRKSKNPRVNILFINKALMLISVTLSLLQPLASWERISLKIH
jgi:hypothetical protein